MIRRPPRSTLSSSSAASDVYKRQVVLLVVDGGFAGWFSVQDGLKDDAAATVKALQSIGLYVCVLTGDNRTTAEAIVGPLGVDELHAEVAPADKLNKVAELQQRGEVVAMVGDGVNDSPALAQADVGIAIGAGAEIAAAAAEIVLVKSRVQDVLHAIDLSEATFRRIRWNFVWAFGFNVVGIPLAAGVLYPPYQWTLPPMFAGLAMACSSITVVLSSLLLQRHTPRSLDHVAEPSNKTMLRHARLMAGHLTITVTSAVLFAAALFLLIIACLILVVVVASHS
eukprot:TRINITY_DN2961_c0_g1_i1.p1 TRINITY_DN2961_c0_g1~~TRINITY_DN2961_c0_g1_i1.p1  ORF type:complete len:282 (-),score=77.19 TRINITY_DN2961_c0_g1_i1:236-1081(-)